MSWHYVFIESMAKINSFILEESFKSTNYGQRQFRDMYTYCFFVNILYLVSIRNKISLLRVFYAKH